MIRPMTSPLRTIHVLVKTRDIADTVERIGAYLYNNFEVYPLAHGEGEDPVWSTIVINGRDNAGWTAEAQAERLCSGLIAAKVVR